ncbi:MAG: nickel-dependent lactate racemase [Clostridia bacterium]|nr:nickel-dependent lactate racemase [Clostridia bacterium]
MQITIPYGHGVQTLNLPDHRIKAILTPQSQARDIPFEDQQALVKAALENPIGSPRLKELCRGKHRILLITSDHTRPVPSRVTLPLMLEEIRQGSPEAEIRILIATGMHRATTHEEILNKVGPEIFEKETILNHDSTRDDEMVFKGTLPSGGELWLNQLVDWAELTVAEGFIEPHFFAGFSGGRKAVLPGIASRKTVMYNHNAEFIAHPLATHASLEGNPIHQDMCFAAEAARLAFILNVTINSQKQVTAAFAGDRTAAHLKGCEACLHHTRVEGVEADIVISSNGGYPLDQNIYQSAKGINTAARSVREGGVIIFCAQCQDGHGGEAYMRFFQEAKTPQEVIDHIMAVPKVDTTPDQWQSQILARDLCRARCIFVTQENNRPYIEAMHMTWAASLEAAYETARGWLGDDASVTVIPDGVGVIVK